jgi:hypothetical protein
VRFSSFGLSLEKPELNPVENIWQYLRQNFVSNRVFRSYQANVDARCEAGNQPIATPTVILSIAIRDWKYKGRRASSMPPNIVHAMRSTERPLLALWFLWTEQNTS